MACPLLGLQPIKMGHLSPFPTNILQKELHQLVSSHHTHWSKTACANTTTQTHQVTAGSPSIEWLPSTLLLSPLPMTMRLISPAVTNLTILKCDPLPIPELFPYTAVKGIQKALPSFDSPYSRLEIIQAGGKDLVHPEVVSKGNDQGM